jgi:hypothetical protein
MSLKPASYSDITKARKLIELHKILDDISYDAKENFASKDILCATLHWMMFAKEISFADFCNIIYKICDGVAWPVFNPLNQSGYWS